MESKLAHLQMIQAVINRMSVNSFLLKGWSVVMVSALFALAAGSSRHPLVYLAFFPCVAFWVLDGYFLWQEGLFRKLYDYVRLKGNENTDFSMSTSHLKNEVDGWFKVIFSKTLNIFHGTVFGIVAVATLVTLYTK